MKATFDTHAIRMAFKMVAQLLPGKKKPNSMDKYVLLNAKSRGTTVSVVNQEDHVAISTEVRGVHTEEPGKCLLDATMFGKWIHEANDQEVNISGDDAGVTVTGQFSEFEMESDDADKYPTPMQMGTDKHAIIKSSDLKWMLERAITCAAVESARYALTGVMFEIEEGRFCTVATDGKQMAILTRKGVEIANGFTTLPGTPVVPSGAIRAILSFLPSTEEPVQVCISLNGASFRSGKTEMYSRLVEGKYPTYREVLPKRKQDMKRVPLMVGPLRNVLRQAAVMTSEDTKGVDLKFAKGTMTALAKTHEVGRAKIQMPVAYDDKAFEVIVDPVLWLKHLATHEADEEIMTHFADNKTIILVESPDQQYVIVPLTRKG